MSDPLPSTSPDQPPAEKGHGRLTLYILIAIIAALAFAWLAPEAAAATAIGGEVFLNLLFMIVVPLVVTSVMSGVLGMGDVRKLGRPGLWTLSYFLGVTVAAVLIGLFVANVFRPGEGTVTEAQRQAAMAGGEKDQEKIRDAIAKAAGVAPEAVVKTFPTLPVDEAPSVKMIAENLVRMLFTKNLIASAAGADLLPLIAFSLFFAAVLTTLGPRVADVSRLIVQSNEALLAVVMVIMKVAPLGIFCLVASRFGEAAAQGGLRTLFTQTGWYSAAVLIGLAIHAFGVLPAIYAIFTRKNPLRFFGQMSEAVLTGFSTASSTATVPVTLEAVVTKAGVSRRAADFVIPLGATVNMSGTALYEAAAALFIAQAVGRDLSLGDQLVVAVTATLAAIGAAGIPEAGLVTMLIVLNAVGLPIEMMALIVPVDWLLDRFRTAVNVFDDAVGAAVVERAMPAE